MNHCEPTPEQLESCRNWPFNQIGFDWPDEALPLVWQYRKTDYSNDGHIAGVWADWIEDHWDECRKTISEGPLKNLLDGLRLAFVNPIRNQSAGSS